MGWDNVTGDGANYNEKPDIEKKHLGSKEYEVELLPIEDAKKYDETFFLIEGVGVDYLSSSSKKISISYMTDFVGSIKSYYEKAVRSKSPTFSLAFFVSNSTAGYQF